MARLPVPGGDVDSWAAILNEFLLVTHNPDGTQRVDSIPAHSVTLRDLDVKNPIIQNIENFVLTNDSERLVWRKAGEVLRATSRLRINVNDYGAKGDGVSDDTEAIQRAIDVAENGGVIEIPRGTYMVRGLKMTKHGTMIVGEARWGTRLVSIDETKPLIEMSGTATGEAQGTGTSGHLRYCTISNLTLNGNRKPGRLLRSIYADSCAITNVDFVYCDDVAVDLVEVWDTRFNNCIWEHCGTNTKPATLLRNSMPQGQFGYSDDNTNQIHFILCRWEGFRNGAIRLDGGANGSTRLLNGIFFTSCKMETRFAAGPPFQIMEGTTIVFVNQLYVAIMAVDMDSAKPIDAISDYGTHIFMTDVYIQWGSERNIANSLVHIHRSGPHMYYKLSTYYPLEDPADAAIVVEEGSTDVVIACAVINRGKLVSGDVSNVMLSSPRSGTSISLDASGTFCITSTVINKDLLKLDNSGTRPYLSAVNGLDLVGFSDSYVTEKWRIIGSTGAARFASGKFQIEPTKGYVGINSVPYTGIAMIIKAAAGNDRGLAIVRPSATAFNRLLEFQDETNAIQGQAFDAGGRPLAVGTPPRVTPGRQAADARPLTQVRDVAGSVKAIVRPTPTAPGPIATITFSRPYDNPPLSIAIHDHSPSESSLFVAARTKEGFTVSTRLALTPGAQVNFDYTVIA